MRHLFLAGTKKRGDTFDVTEQLKRSRRASFDSDNFCGFVLCLHLGFMRSIPTLELTGRGRIISSLQVLRMKAALFPLRLNELLDRVPKEFMPLLRHTHDTDLNTSLA